MTAKDFKTAIPLIGTIFTIDHDLLNCPGPSYCNHNSCPFRKGPDCSISKFDHLTPKQLTYLQTHHPELLL